MNLLLLILIIILLCGGGYGWHAGWGPYPMSGLGVVLFILILLVLMGRL